MRPLVTLASLALAVAACLPANARQVDMAGMHRHAAPDTPPPAHGTPAAAHAAHAAGHHATHAPAPAAHPQVPAMHHPAPAQIDHARMDHAGMDHAGMDHAGMDHAAMDHAAMDHASMDHAPMQGGRPPAGARDPDYSEGVSAAPMHGTGMAMEGRPRLAWLRADRLESFHGRQGNGQQWEIEAGVGDNLDGLWLRSEGERPHGGATDADVELLWRHAVGAFWDTQLGVRADIGEGADRQWLAFGLQGLAPYWFELEATGYVGPAGRTAVRLRADYELLFTQRLVLQPELELNAYGRADPARGLGSGLSDATLGLRLRYEIRREVAPYVGGLWRRRFGGTADHGRALFEWQWVAGVRIRL